MFIGSTGSIAIGIVGTSIFWHDDIKPYLLWWLLALTLSCLANSFAAKKFRGLAETQALKALYTFTVLGLLAGLIWSIPVYWLNTGYPEVIQPGFGSIFIIFVTMGLATSAMGSTSAYLPFYYFSVTPFSLTLLIICNFATINGLPVNKFVVPLLLFFTAIFWFTYNINRGLITAIDLKHYNEELAEKYLKEKEKAELANHQKSKFLAAASHDLRQPLQSLSLFSELLSDEVLTERGKQIIASQQVSLNNLAQLLDALLDISKLDAQSLSPTMTDIPLSDLFNNLNSNFKEQAQAKRIDLNFESQGLWVKSDYFLLLRCLSNLIDNALTHSGSPMVFVTASKKDINVVINVIDQGVGIEKHQHVRVFNEFEQLNNPERDRQKGLGLGLSIVRKTLQLLNHEMAFSSSRAFGTQFGITIPKGEVLDIQPLKSLERTIDLSGKIIWIIEDEIEINKALSEVIEKWNAKVFNATNKLNIDGSFIISKPLPDLIISDYRLPKGVTGGQLVKDIREQFQQIIPAIIISGEVLSELDIQSLAPPFLVLKKPISGGKLRLAIQNLIL